jgi:LEA14-like dessication related protein
MKLVQRIICISSAITLGGAVLCSFSAGLKKPTVEYKRVEVKQVTFKDTKVEFVYSVDNPNPLGLKDIGVDYKLFLGVTEKPANGQPTASGNDIKFDIKAKAVSEFRLPMTINYEGFFETAERLTKIILSGQKTIPFVLDTTFKLDIKILKFEIPVESKGELPLPEVSTKDIFPGKLGEKQ